MYPLIFAPFILKTFKLFKYGDKSYGVETSSGSVYEWNTNTNTIGKDLIGNVTGRNSFSSGGFVRRYATAGFVSGPGTGTSDSIPAMLSNGEYVIRANAVSKYGIGMLSKINTGDFGVGSLSSPSYSINSASNIPSGTKANYANVDNSSVYNSYSINVTASSGMSTEDVANAVMTKIKQYGDRNIRGNRI